jgi:hypothetical protein
MGVRGRHGINWRTRDFTLTYSGYQPEEKPKPDPPKEPEKETVILTALLWEPIPEGCSADEVCE